MANNPGDSFQLRIRKKTAERLQWNFRISNQ